MLVVNLPDQSRQHAPDVDKASVNGVGLRRIATTPFSRNAQLEQYLAGRRVRVVEIRDKRLVGLSAATLEDVRADRHCGAAHLCCETVALIARKGVSVVVNGERQVLGLTRDAEFVGVLHGSTCARV